MTWCSCASIPWRSSELPIMRQNSTATARRRCFESEATFLRAQKSLGRTCGSIRRTRRSGDRGDWGRSLVSQFQILGPRRLSNCAHNRVMRRFVSLTLALFLVVLGAAGLTYLLVFAAGWKGWMVMGAGLVFTLGVIWLYDDLANPSLTHRRGNRQGAEGLGSTD